MTDEAQITINGKALSVAESMTVRVALESFAMDLHETGLGTDSHGLTMTKNYLAAIDSIRAFIHP